MTSFTSLIVVAVMSCITVLYHKHTQTEFGVWSLVIIGAQIVICFVVYCDGYLAGLKEAQEKNTANKPANKPAAKSNQHQRR